MDMQGRLGRLRAAGLRQDVVLLILFCAMVAAFSLVNPRFFSVRAMANILQDFCPVMLMAIGQTFVIASRGIDLSVGAVLGLAGFLAFYGREVFDWCVDAVKDWKRRRDWENRNR